MTRVKRIGALMLALITIFSFMTVTIAAATTFEKRVANCVNHTANTYTYTMTKSYFNNNPKVTIKNRKFVGQECVGGTVKEERKFAEKYARFDVTVTWKNANGNQSKTFKGLKFGDSFPLGKKKWNEKITYTVKVKSYFSGYSNKESRYLHGACYGSMYALKH